MLWPEYFVVDLQAGEDWTVSRPDLHVVGKFTRHAGQNAAMFSKATGLQLGKNILNHESVVAVIILNVW